MFWSLVLIAPFGALLPGEVGRFFRGFQTMLGALGLILLAIVVWVGVVSYSGVKCELGNQDSCKTASTFFHLPYNLTFGAWHDAGEAVAAQKSAKDLEHDKNTQLMLIDNAAYAALIQVRSH